MIAILTGDIINSRKDSELVWLKNLKQALNKHGKSPKNWDIYRGDSFQLEVSAEEALETSIIIKASIKQERNTDVRIAIGLGSKTYDADTITESNGTAFEYSGECFENLKKSTLAIKSHSESFNGEINLLLNLALLTMNNWKPSTARVIKLALQNQQFNQEKLALELQLKSQSSISEALSRGGHEEILKMIMTYKNKIKTLL